MIKEVREKQRDVNIVKKTQKQLKCVKVIN